MYLYQFVVNTAVHILRDEGKHGNKIGLKMVKNSQTHQSSFFLIFNANNKINKFQEDIVCTVVH